MTFQGKHPIRMKIIVENKSRKQAQCLKFLGCKFSYESNKDIKMKELVSYEIMCGTIRRTPKSMKKIHS